MHLDAHDDLGIVIADKPGGGPREDGRWLAEALPLTDGGTEYVTADRIVLPIVTVPSHYLPHPQLADLIVAAMTAAVAGLPHGMELARCCASSWSRAGIATAAAAGSCSGPTHWSTCTNGCSVSPLDARQHRVPLPVADLPYDTNEGLSTALTPGGTGG